MKIIALRGKGREEREVPAGASAMDVLAQLGLLPDAHIVLREGTPIPIDEPLVDGDTLKIIKVASGG